MAQNGTGAEAMLLSERDKDNLAWALRFLREFEKKRAAAKPKAMEADHGA